MESVGNDLPYAVCLVGEGHVVRGLVHVGVQIHVRTHTEAARQCLALFPSPVLPSHRASL